MKKSKGQIPSKEVLHKLESEGLYVFHGSAYPDIKVMIPKQGTHVPDVANPTSMILDGRPGVSATPYADIAIFRAIINNENIKLDHSSRFGLKESSTGYSLFFNVSSPDVIDTARDKHGYVYAFNKLDFEKYDREGDLTGERMEWRSYKPVRAIKKIKVLFDDINNVDKIGTSL